MRLKENIVIFYNDLQMSCDILVKDEQISIEDPNKTYFEMLSDKKLRNVTAEVEKFLRNNNLVIEDYDDSEVDAKFQRNLYYFEDALTKNNIDPVAEQLSLHQKKVCIVGCGGIGTVVLKNLISNGICKFVLIDGDIVDPSNLNRQLFFNRGDYGKKKVDVLKDKIESSDNSITAQCYDVFIENKNIITDIIGKTSPDILINCADLPNNINDILGAACSLKKTPFIFGTVGIISASWGPIFDSRHPYKNSEKTTYDFHIKGSFSETNMILSAYLANDIIKYLLNEDNDDLYKRKYIDFQKFQIEKDTI